MLVPTVSVLRLEAAGRFTADPAAAILTVSAAASAFFTALFAVSGSMYSMHVEDFVEKPELLVSFLKFIQQITDFLSSLGRPLL